MPRSLAAVLAADVVGYSALMGADETGALAALRRLRAEIFAPAVAARRGRVVKSMGDGWIVLFPSAVDAVTCALQVQERLAERETIRLRMGVHIGDVTEEDEDVFGDGVNIAARLEAAAEPGAVAISDAAHGALDGALRLGFDDQGATRLKNIDRPVRVWSRGGALAGAERDEAGPAGFPHLAIAPVTTSDERAEMRELADALTGEFAGWLRGAVWLTSETTATPGPGAYVLRGLLRARGDRLRLEVTLDAPDLARLWSAKHDGDLADGFDWQDRTAEAVVAEAFGQLFADQRRRLDRVPEAQADAAQLFLKAILSIDASAEGWAGALRLLELAIARDAAWPLPRAMAAGVWFAGASSAGAAAVAPWAARWPVWAEEAERLAPSGAQAGVLGAMLRLARGGDPETARAEARSLLRLRPFDHDALFWASWVLLYAGEPDTALAGLRRARRVMSLSFYLPSTELGIGHASLQLGDDAAAAAHAAEAVRLQPGYGSAWRLLAAAEANLGRMEAASEAVRRVLRLNPQETVSGTWARTRYPDTPGLNRYRDGLLKAGLPA